ncbi:MAG: YraN family protein [Planctomycetota bacterium]
MLLPWVQKKLLTDPHRLGRWGQNRAEQYLRRKGLRTIARNYAFSGGEVDLVMAGKDGTMVFTEVKTRRNEDFYPAIAAVNQKKRRKITRTAKRFLKQFQVSDRPLRFDIITVVLGEKGKPDIQHYPNAFV